MNIGQRKTFDITILRLEDGVFQVSVIGTDVDGGSAQAAGSVGVIPITFSVTSSKSAEVVNVPFLFTVSGIPAGVPINRYIWDFGDGQGQTTTTPTASHAYQAPGLKTITVTVVPRYGESRTASFQVLVNP